MHCTSSTVSRTERFLAYDAELGLDPPVHVEKGRTRQVLINKSDTPLYDVVIARSTPEGCRVAWLDVLPPEAAIPASANAKKPEAKPAEPDASQLFDDAPSNKADEVPKEAPAEEKSGGAQQPPAGEQADKKAAAKPAELQLFGGLPKKVEAKLLNQTAATKKPGAGLFGGLPQQKKSRGVEVTLSEPLAAGSPEAIERTTRVLADRLAKTGLTQDEVALFVGRYAPLFFEGEGVVVGARLDPASRSTRRLGCRCFPCPRRPCAWRWCWSQRRSGDGGPGRTADRRIGQSNVLPARGRAAAAARAGPRRLFGASEGA